MKKVSLFLLILFAYSCSTRNDDNKVKVEVNKPVTLVPDFNVALKFINEYAEFCDNQIRSEAVDSNWINNHSLLTNSFKKRYKAIVDSAAIEDPENGLDFDPIFDAQDYPDNGFDLMEIDKATGFATVQGKDWKEFTLVMKVVCQNGKSLVDGVGIVNIPICKRIKR